MNETGKTELGKLLKEQLPATRGDDGSGVTMLAHAGRCVFGDPPPEPASNAAALATLDRMAAALPDVEAAGQGPTAAVPGGGIAGAPPSTVGASLDAYLKDVLRSHFKP